MKIGGPFLDPAKKGQPRPWYLSYFLPRLNPDGSAQLDARGKPVLARMRPFYESKAKAAADIARIREEHSAVGSSSFVVNRDAAAEYEAAKRIVGEVSLLDVAKFWRRHHPEKPKQRLEELVTLFLADVEMRLEPGRHWSDRKSRLGAFLRAGFGPRYPESVDRAEVLNYVRNIPQVKPRTKRNHKTAICEFFNWMVDHGHAQTNPAAGIKKNMLPREKKEEIRFLSLAEVERYLRAVERYDPELVAHEIVQLIAGVRADDEMADFRAEFVHANTREVVIPAEIAKTETREVINQLEEIFWEWWKHYGPARGLLRPRNHGPRWDRIRVLSAMTDQSAADLLAQMPIKSLLRLPESRGTLAQWPWNARRRTFCTYHVAKYQSADKTALIMRHRGSPYTLHNSYRGLGVTQEEGETYFRIGPAPVSNPVHPHRTKRGIVAR
jgi:integrase